MLTAIIAMIIADSLPKVLAPEAQVLFGANDAPNAESPKPMPDAETETETEE